MDDEPTWLDVCHKAIDAMRGAAASARGVASRLAYAIPESPAIRQLQQRADDLDLWSAKLDEAIAKKVGDDCRAAREHSNNMLRAACAGLIGSGKVSEEEAKGLRGIVGAVEEWPR